MHRDRGRAAGVTRLIIANDAEVLTITDIAALAWLALAADRAMAHDAEGARSLSGQINETSVSLPEVNRHRPLRKRKRKQIAASLQAKPCILWKMHHLFL